MKADSDRQPSLPHLLAAPLTVIPPEVHGAVLVTMLNRVSAAALQDGELDFIRGRTACVRLSDMPLAFCITLEGNGLAASRPAAVAELSLSGNLHAFLQLAGRCEDAGTLFFRRRLRMEGDTEPGLEVRNFLDGLDIDAHWLPRQVSRLARRALSLYEHPGG